MTSSTCNKAITSSTTKTSVQSKLFPFSRSWLSCFWHATTFHQKNNCQETGRVLISSKKPQNFKQQKTQLWNKQPTEASAFTDEQVKHQHSKQLKYEVSHFSAIKEKSRQTIIGSAKSNSDNESLNFTNEILYSDDEGLDSKQKMSVGIDDFIFLESLGKGSHGKVFMARYKRDNRIYAIKVIHKKNVNKRLVECVKAERQILGRVNHPFIVKLHFAFQTTNRLYFVLDYCPGGELYFHLSRSRRFSEAQTKFYAAQIVLALEYLHEENIAYRDLKPENILLDETGHIRLTDFGLSKIIVYDDSTYSFCGTPEYLAPEVLSRRGHGKAVDWWTFGTLIYEMLTGLPPFFTSDRDSLFESIQKCELILPSEISRDARNLIKGLLNKCPRKRLGGGFGDAKEVKSHPYFSNVDWNAVYHKAVPAPFVPELESETDIRWFHSGSLDQPTFPFTYSGSFTEQAKSNNSRFDNENVFSSFDYSN